MGKKRPRATGPDKPRQPRKDSRASKAYDHPKEKLLLRPDVGLQPQFKPTKPPKKYRYDPSLDPALSRDITGRVRTSRPGSSTPTTMTWSST